MGGVVTPQKLARAVDRDFDWFSWVSPLLGDPAPPFRGKLQLIPVKRESSISLPPGHGLNSGRRDMKVALWGRFLEIFPCFKEMRPRVEMDSFCFWLGDLDVTYLDFQK